MASGRWVKDTAGGTYVRFLSDGTMLLVCRRKNGHWDWYIGEERHADPWMRAGYFNPRLAMEAANAWVTGQLALEANHA